jgi:uncharacterized small protein (DUF1192 family)
MDGASVNVRFMDVEEVFPKRADDPLAALGRQDLDPFSVAELHARITALEAEIARARRKLEASVNHRTTADALFKR